MPNDDGEDIEYSRRFEGLPDEFLHDTEGISHVTFDANPSKEGFHDWNLVVEYEDGRTTIDYLGTWDAEPPSWVWRIYEWYEDQDIDVDIEYEED